MQKIILLALTIIILNANTTTPIKNNLPRTVEPKAQAKADAQLRIQNKKIIKMVVAEIGKNLPQKIDNYTTFVSITDENLTLVSTYEINTGEKSDEKVRVEDQPRMQEFVVEGICRSSKRFLQADINITYVYKNKTTKVELFRFEVEANNCIDFWKE